MFWVEFSAILFVILFILLGIRRKSDSKVGYAWKLCKRQLLSLLAFLLIIGSMFANVPANSVGIIYSPFKRRYTGRGAWRRRVLQSAV